MPVTLEASQCSDSASALMGSSTPGSRFFRANICIGARSNSDAVLHTRGLWWLKNSSSTISQASRSGSVLMARRYP